jgi:hypothetical protein
MSSNFKEKPLSTVKPDRRPKAAVALLAIAALFGALLAVSLPASADTAGNQVVTTATTPTQIAVAPNGPLTGLRNKDVVTINATASGVSSNLIYGIDARLCRTGINIVLTSQFTASSGNCAASPLATATSTFVQKTVGSPNTSGSINFIVPQGAETVASHAGPGAPIVCNSSNPCSLWIREAVPTAIIASGNAFVHYDLQFATPGAPTAATATAGVGSALVSWTAPTDDAGSPGFNYAVTSSPGGLTCTSATASCTVPGLDPFTAYTFSVKATNGAGSTGAASAASNAVTPGPATAPVITSAVAGNGSATITWAGTSPAPVSYTVSSKQKTTSGPTCSTATTSCVVSGLTNGLPYTFVVTATFTGGTTVSAVSVAVTPRIIADLLSLNTAALTTPRAGIFSVVEGVTNNGPSASLAILTISVTNATETSIVPDAGLTCSAPVVVGLGLKQVCSTDAPLAPGATLNVGLTLAPQADPLLTSIAISNAVSLPVTSPTIYSDPVTNNNKISHTVKIFDTADLSASFTGGSSVGRTGTYVADGTITNNGTDPVYAKFTIAVGYASEAGFTADVGLTCTGPIANVAGTGFSRVCTTTAPLASGASLHVQLQLAPSADPKKYGLTVSGTAARAKGNVTDPNTLNNKSALKVAITDSVDLSTTLTAPSASVVRASTITLDGTITNNGPDTATGKTIVSIVGGTIQSVTSDGGLSCVGIGTKTTCTITSAVPSGTTLNFHIVVLPSTKLTVTSLTATSTASVLGGVTVTDPISGNNVASVTVAII